MNTFNIISILPDLLDNPVKASMVFAWTNGIANDE